MVFVFFSGVSSVVETLEIGKRIMGFVMLG